MTQDYAKKLTDLRHASLEKFNNTVVTISSGALALTIAFGDSYEGRGPCFESFLKTMWVLFTICTVLGTFQSWKGAYIAEKGIRQLQADSSAVEVKPIPFFVWSQRVIAITFFLAISMLCALGLFSM